MARSARQDAFTRRAAASTSNSAARYGESLQRRFGCTSETEVGIGLPFSCVFHSFLLTSHLSVRCKRIRQAVLRLHSPSPRVPRCVHADEKGLSTRRFSGTLVRPPRKCNPRHRARGVVIGRGRVEYRRQLGHDTTRQASAPPCPFPLERDVDRAIPPSARGPAPPSHPRT